MKRFLYIVCRAIDYRVGLTDHDKPEVPILTQQEAWTAFSIKLAIIIINFITCAAVIANVIHHW
jgi:hypothetical protein